MKINLTTPDMYYIPMYCPVKGVEVIYMPKFIYALALSWGINRLQNLGQPPTYNTLIQYLQSVDNLYFMPPKYRGKDLSTFVYTEERYKYLFGWGNFQMLVSKDINFLHSLN